MKRVSFNGLPKYERGFLRSLMFEHNTRDPEEALKKGNIEYRLIEFRESCLLRRVGTYFIEDNYYKWIYVDDNDLIAIHIIDNRCRCILQ